MKIRIATVIFILVFMLSIFFVFKKIQFDRHSEKPEECAAHIISVRKDSKVDLVINFIVDLKNQVGDATIGGVVYKKNKPFGIIDRKVNFRFSENSSHVKFTSLNIQKDIKNETLSDDIQLTILPDFYVLPGKSITYSIIPQREQGYLFLVNQLPYFFCAKPVKAN